MQLQQRRIVAADLVKAGREAGAMEAAMTK